MIYYEKKITNYFKMIQFNYAIFHLISLDFPLNLDLCQ
jgi:hypothetical protein